MPGRSAPAAERNKEPILTVLRRVLPPAGLVLEIGSGTGQHVFHFARALPQLTWQPSDPAPACRESIHAWTADSALPNVREVVALDVHKQPWPIAQADAVVSINMIHVAPWSATPGLIAGAENVLPDGGLLFLYGPYRRFGQHTAPSNEAFDAQLRAQNPAWGVRDLEAVAEQAGNAGFELIETAAMPANNFSVVFRKRARHN
jgi:hypothetical protein